MRVKVDEDLPRSVANLLRDKGHDGVTVVEQGMGGWSDERVWQVVQAEKRFLITHGLAFAT